jgi:hypothetical protein
MYVLCIYHDIEYLVFSCSVRVILIFISGKTEFFSVNNASDEENFVLNLFQPRIDEKHVKWLHLRIRPSTVPFLDPEKFKGKTKKYLVDGRWTLAFRDEQSCKAAEAMVVEEMKLQQDAVRKQLRPLLELGMPEDGLQHHQPSQETLSDDDGSETD